MKKLLTILVILNAHNLLAMEKEPKEQDLQPCLATITLSCDHSNDDNARQALCVSLPQPNGSLQEIFHCYFAGPLCDSLPHEGTNDWSWKQSDKKTQEHNKLASEASLLMRRLFFRSTGKSTYIFELGAQEKSSLFAVDENQEKTLLRDICAQKEKRLRKENIKNRLQMPSFVDCINEEEEEECKKLRSQEPKIRALEIKISTLLTDLAKKFLALCASKPEGKKE